MADGCSLITQPELIARFLEYFLVEEIVKIAAASRSFNSAVSIVSRFVCEGNLLERPALFLRFRAAVAVDVVCCNVEELRQLVAIVGSGVRPWKSLVINVEIPRLVARRAEADSVEIEEPEEEEEEEARSDEEDEDEAPDQRDGQRGRPRSDRAARQVEALLRSLALSLSRGALPMLEDFRANFGNSQAYYLNTQLYDLARPPTKRGMDALVRALSPRLAVRLALQWSLACARTLLETHRSIDVNESGEYMRCCLLCWIDGANDSERSLALLRLLIQRGARVDHVDRDGRSILCATAGCALVDGVGILLEAGASVTLGASPLFACCGVMVSGHFSPPNYFTKIHGRKDNRVHSRLARIFKKLLDHGADPYKTLAGKAVHGAVLYHLRNTTDALHALDEHAPHWERQLVKSVVDSLLKMVGDLFQTVAKKAAAHTAETKRQRRRSPRHPPREEHPPAVGAQLHLAETAHHHSSGGDAASTTTTTQASTTTTTHTPAATTTAEGEHVPEERDDPRAARRQSL